MNKQAFIDKAIVHMGHVYRVIGVGAQLGGNTYCHLASLTEGRMQKNGWYADQICDWVDDEVLKKAARAA